MNKCEEIRSRLILYVDEELQGNELSSLEAHLHECDACRSVFKSEQRFLQTVRQSRRLHVASPELRNRVRELVHESPVVPAPPMRLRRRLHRVLWPHDSIQRWPLSWRMVAVAAIAVLVLPVVLWFSRQDQQTTLNAPSEFALMAADAHLRHIRGQLPLEIASGTPAQISDWFANKVGFSVKLPNYQESSGQEKLYRLEGARLVGYKDDYAAYVAYQMKTRPISLVITADTVAQPTGGEEIKARGLTFHYNAIHGLKVITWSDRGLTYALVSDLEERGQQSCIVCHEGTRDQDFIAPLKPQ